MARYGDHQIEFVILGLVRDATYQYKIALAENIRALQRLSEHQSWHNGTGVLLGPSPRYGIDQSLLDRTNQPPAQLFSAGNPPSVFPRARELQMVQETLKSAINESQTASQLEEERTNDYRLDYGSVLQIWVGLLARKGALEGLLACT